MKKLYVIGASSKVSKAIEGLANKDWLTVFYGRNNPHGLARFVEYPGITDEASVVFLKDLIINDLSQTASLEEAGLVVLAGVSSHDWRLSYLVNEYMPAVIADSFAAEVTDIELANRSIVLFSTSGAYQGAKLTYATTKASLTGAMHSIARDYSGKVRINIVLPSAFDGEMIADWSDGKREAVASVNYIGRLGRAEDMADAVLFATNNRFITNSIINMTGGTIHI